MKSANAKRLVLILIAISVGMIACSKKTGQDISQNESSQLEERFLHFQLSSEPEYIDPGLASGVPETRVILDLFSGLVQHSQKDGPVVPEMATDWKISKDNLVYTFRLRKEAVWSDGRPVTAHDFVYAWERVLNPKTAAKYAYSMYPIRNARDYNAGKITDPAALGFKALDDHTLKVTLESPTPYFLDLLWYNAFKPVPSWVVEKFGPKWTQPENIVSNGTFLLKSWTPYKEITLVKNPRYFEADQVKLPGVVFYPMEDKETALKMYKRGEIDIVWEVSVVKADALRGEEGYVQTPYLGSYFYRVQTKRPPLNDLRVRQALSLAIDRDELVGKFLKNTMIPSLNIVPEGLTGYARAEGIGFDPEKAKRLLTEAGYSDPKTFPAISIHYNTDDRHKLIAQVVQQMWKRHLGIDVKLWNEEWKSYMKTQNLKNFEISRSGWIADYPDPMTFLDLWTSDSTMSHTSWSNPQYDTLIRNAMKETVTSKRYAVLRQAEQLLLEEAPVIPIYTYTKIYLQKPYVKGYLPNREDMHPFKWVSLSEGEKSSELVAEERQ